VGAEAAGRILCLLIRPPVSDSAADLSVTFTAALLVCCTFLRAAGCIQVLTQLKATGGQPLTDELLREALQRHLPANIQLRACRLMLPSAEQATAAPADAASGLWCQPAALLAGLAARPDSPQELTLHVPQQLLAATAAAGRGVRIVVSDGGTSAAVLDRSIRAGDAAWPGDGVLRLQLPPCEGPLVLLHLLSTAPAGAAQHAADELLGTAALLALPSAPACSEVNSMFDRMTQEAQPGGRADRPSAAAFVFNHQLRAFVMDCVQLLAPGGGPRQQQLARHMQTFLALQDMRACLQLLRTAGVKVSAQLGHAGAVASARTSPGIAGMQRGAAHGGAAGKLAATQAMRRCNLVHLAGSYPGLGSCVSGCCSGDCLLPACTAFADSAWHSHLAPQARQSAHQQLLLQKKQAALLPEPDAALAGSLPPPASCWASPARCRSRPSRTGSGSTSPNSMAVRCGRGRCWSFCRPVCSCCMGCCGCGAGAA